MCSPVEMANLESMDAVLMSLKIDTNLLLSALMMAQALVSSKPDKSDMSRLERNIVVR